MSLRPVLVSVFLTIILATPLASANTGERTSLLEIYELAVNNDPAIREARANRDAARERYPQARGQLLPQISLSASYQDAVREGASIGADPDTGQIGLQDFRRDTDTTQIGLQLRQTLFNWGQFQELGQAEAAVAEADALFEAEMQNLAIRVAEAYFDLLAALDEQASARANEEAILRQRERAERRFEVGLIAITDVQEAKAAYDNAVADRIAADRQVSLRREQMREIIGQYPGEILAPEENMPLSLPDPADPEAWVTRAREGNYSVLASRFAMEAAESAVRRARAQHYPTLDLVANVGRTEQRGEDLFDQQDVDSRSIQLQFNLPLYSGGQRMSQTRQARAELERDENRLERTLREAERMTRDAYLGVLSERSRVRALRQAVESNQTALQATEAGFEVGTRTTVDILDARQALFNAQTSYARSRYDFLINTLRLRQATGELGMDDIRQLNALLGADPGEAVEDLEVDTDDMDLEGARPGQ
ncbi:TolC family outer membrane protein [Natronospira bacteriovora]|uniref:Protein CyaE n=1 Tax=Natronospira bacteriovora TaxID=3069753 RepID=A0ABU0W6F8_9GAMM|nr:TolC family outer membrane protein [Natronospira sp. AB-CW4]MDQ2069611.1 TolC family outer membrane protein [Natronospira sp. AB-CW4]